MLTYTHHFQDGDRARTLLLLHGTGGDEHDLLPLGAEIAPGAALLSPRGKVSEHGSNRFFRRLAEGVFDMPDLLAKTDDLAEFVVAARETYGLGAPVAVGFSNGANIAASILLKRPGVLAGAVLLRAMTPFPFTGPATLDGTPVLVLSGAMDPIVPAGNATALVDSLKRAGAIVTHETLPAGHGLTRRDLELARAFLADQTARRAA